MMASPKIVDAIEKAVDVVEETAETVERIPKVHLNGTTKGQQFIILGVTAVFSATAGGVITYLVLNKKLKTKYELISEKEIEDTRNHYRMVRKQGEYKDPVSALENLQQQIGEHGYAGSEESGSVVSNLATKVEDAAETLEEVSEDLRDAAENQREEADGLSVNNIFTDHRPTYPGWDWGVQLSKRSPGVPYVIAEAEYFQNENDWPQETWTFFESDGILVDERESPVDDTDNVIGDGNLQQFGRGTTDPNVVYVRNEHLEMEFEIRRSKKTYTEEVFGINVEPELKHADSRGAPRRFRDRDG